VATLYKRGRVYYIQFYRNGRQHRFSLKTGNRALARRIKEEVERKLLLGEFDVREKQKPVPIDEFKRRYFEWAAQNKRPNTVSLEELFFRQFVEFSRIRFLDQACREDAEAFKAHMIKRGLKPVTVNDALRHLKAIYNYARKWGLLRHNPFEGVERLKVEKNPPRYLSREEIERVLEAAERHGRDIHLVFALGIYAGLRKNEIVNARWEWFDFEQKLITLSSHEGFQLKDYETRTIPLHSRLAGILEPYRRESGFIFNPDVERPRKYRYRYDFKRAFNTVCKQAGLEWVTPHILRHTFASQLAIAGVSLYKISKWLGHSDFKTTQVYAHLQQADDDIERL